MLTAGEVYLLRMIEQGILEIRNDGSIWRLFKRGRTGSLCRRPAKRADTSNAAGYRKVQSMENGVTYNAMAHRLIWINNFGPTSLQINHINGVVDDNRLENLEAVTPSENQIHSYRQLGRPVLSGEQQGFSKLTNLQAEQILALKGKQRQKDVAERFGVSRYAIYSIWSGKGWRRLLTREQVSLPDLDQVSLEIMLLATKALGIKNTIKECSRRAKLQIEFREAMRAVLPEGDPRRDPNYPFDQE